MPPHPCTVAPAGAVLITGASTGIGAATAAALADAGFFVFAGVRSRSAGAALVTSLGGPARAAALLLDVTDAVSVEAATLAVAAALEDTGSGEQGGKKPPPPPRRLAALVNNAGVSFPGPLLACPPSELASHLAVNLGGALAVTRAVAPLLGVADAVGVPGLGRAWRRQGRGEEEEEAVGAQEKGAPAAAAAKPLRPLPALAPPSSTGRGRPIIINISSVAGRVAGPFMGGYAASKHGLEGASDALRREVAPFGVEVVVVELGAVATPLWAKADALDPARYNGTAWAGPLRTFMKLMGQEGAAGHPASAAGAAVADVVARAGRAPPPPPAGAGWAAAAAASLAHAAWAAAVRPPPRVELIARRWLVWTAPLSLPDRVTDWAVAAGFGL